MNRFTYAVRGICFGLGFPGFRLAVTRQSAIGEKNLLTIVIPDQGRIFAAGVPEPRCESGLSWKLLPDSPNYKQVHAEAPIARQHARYQPV